MSPAEEWIETNVAGVQMAQDEIGEILWICLNFILSSIEKSMEGFR